MNIQEILDANDLTQSQMARGMGVHKQQVSLWCIGRYRPSMANREKIIRWLKKHNYHY